MDISLPLFILLVALAAGLLTCTPSFPSSSLDVSSSASSTSPLVLLRPFPRPFFAPSGSGLVFRPPWTTPPLRFISRWKSAMSSFCLWMLFRAACFEALPVVGGVSFSFSSTWRWAIGVRWTVPGSTNRPLPFLAVCCGRVGNCAGDPAAWSSASSSCSSSSSTTSIRSGGVSCMTSGCCGAIEGIAALEAGMTLAGFTAPRNGWVVVPFGSPSPFSGSGK